MGEKKQLQTSKEVNKKLLSFLLSVMVEKQVNREGE